MDMDPPFWMVVHSAHSFPFHMLRIFLICLTFATAALAQLHTLGPGRDLNEAVNLSEFVLIKWMDGMDNHVVGIDAAKNRLILARYDNLNQYGPKSVTLLGTLREGVSRSATLILAHTDDDGGKDLVLLENDDAYIWTSATRQVSGPWSAPVHLKLPVPLPLDDYGGLNPPTPPQLRDLDQDGKDDLIFPGGIQFSFGRPGATWYPLEYGISVGPAWVYGGPPTLRLSTTQSDGGFGYTYTYTIHYFTPARELVEIPDTMHRFHGMLANVLGEYPPQLVVIGLDLEDKSYVQATIHRHTSTGWQVAETLRTKHYFTASDAPYMVAGDITNKTSYGDQQIHFVMQSWQGDAELWNLSRRGFPSVLALVRVDSIPGGVASLREQLNPAGYSPRSFLSIIRKNDTGIHTFSGPFFPVGGGTSASLLHAPLDSRDEVHFFAEKNVSVTHTGELNGDGLPDLFAMREDGRATPFISPALAPGAPLEHPSAYYWQPTSMLLVDGNGDGLADPLFLSQREAISYRTTIMGAGLPPTFPLLATSESLDWMPSLKALGTGDFDGDGDADLLFIHAYYETLAWAENLGGGQYGTVHHISAAGRIRNNRNLGSYHWIGTEQVQIGDFDGDGDIDIITSPSALGNRVALHRNHGGTFSLEPLSPLLGQLPGQQPAIYSYGLSSIKIGRFFRDDPHTQIALCADMVDENTGYMGSGVWIIRLTPAGPIISPQPVSFGTQTSVVFTVADFDGDGLDDLIGGRSGTDNWVMAVGPLPTGILCLLSNGDGTFGTLRDLGPAIGHATGIDARDYDGDGRCDVLLTSSHTNTIELFTHQEIPAPPTYTAWAMAHGLSPDDIHGDGDHDGIPNLMEYAAGTSPHAASTTPQTMTIPGEYDGFDPFITLRQTRPSLPSGVSVGIVAEYSTDLIQWHPVPTPPSISVDSQHPTRENLLWQIPRWHPTTGAVHPAVFVRYHFTRPPE